MGERDGGEVAGLSGACDNEGRRLVTSEHGDLVNIIELAVGLPIEAGP